MFAPHVGTLLGDIQYGLTVATQHIQHDIRMFTQGFFQQLRQIIFRHLAGGRTGFPACQKHARQSQQQGGNKKNFVGNAHENLIF